MLLTETFKARGHSNIRAKHRTTVMTTTKPYLTLKGDCVVAVSAEKGLRDLKQEIKTAAQNSEATIRLTLSIGDEKIDITGKGHPDLLYEDPYDIVTRTSNYVCPRTLMLGADKAAKDLPRAFIKQLTKPDVIVTVTITVDDGRD